MRVVLISTYDLGRQPFGLASPAAWLTQAGVAVSCQDLAKEPLREDEVSCADAVAFYVPMHTATKLAARLLDRVRQLNPRAHLCFYGLYAPMNEAYLRRLGAQTILGGEFEPGLVRMVERLRLAGASPGAARRDQSQGEPVISLDKLPFKVPERRGLPPLHRYAQLLLPDGETRLAGYTEASRGCKHRCRHCPIVPVYNGQFRIVQRQVVLADIRQQVAAGARHLTFGDPDFFNGVRHALALVEALHDEFPALTYDVTIKVQHLLRHAEHLETLRRTGCAFVTSAVESVDDRFLRLLDKGHTRDDFHRVAARCREAGVTLAPTFVPFSPWTTFETYLELLRVLVELDLVENVAPIQLAMRLLLPAGSRLLELQEVQRLVGDFAPDSLSYPWSHSDPRLDTLCWTLQALVKEGEQQGLTRRRLFAQLWQAAHEAAGRTPPSLAMRGTLRQGIPFLNEPWYC
ncbi:MAG: radical SAM protein [Candidatus Tectomicrobia bacterium]|nr:radical SAM protein [Candidatus Tectomicrobia bacterium]